MSKDNPTQMFRELYDDVELEIPVRLYEFKELVVLLTFVGFILSSEIYRSIDHGILLSLVSGLIYTYGTWVDNASTRKALQINQELLDQGIKSPIYESNDQMIGVDSLQQYNAHHWNKVLTALIPVAFLYPPLGIPAGLSRIVASRNNKVKIRRLTLARERMVSQP